MIEIQIDVTKSTPEELESFLAHSGVARTLDTIAYTLSPQVRLNIKGSINKGSKEKHE